MKKGTDGECKGEEREKNPPMSSERKETLEEAYRGQCKGLPPRQQYRPISRYIITSSGFGQLGQENVK
jgi:hypothetical protein